MNNEGRFFPGSAVWTAVVFGNLQSTAAYKLFLAVLVLTMIVLAALLGVQITARPSVGVVTGLMLATTVTLRAWFDGLDTFSGIVPLTVGLALGTVLLLVRGRGRTSVVVAVALWTYALTTYEVVILLTPGAALLVWWLRRSAVRTIATVVPSALLGLFVLWLRSRVSSPAAAYVVNLEPWRVAVAGTKQLGAALPLSQQWFPGAQRWVTVSPSMLVVSLAVVGVPVGVALVAVIRTRTTVARVPLLVLAVTGVCVWALPNALVAVSLGWQNELPRGQGYVSVVWGYVGVAMLFTAAWWQLASSWARRPGSRWRAAALGTATLVACVLASATAAQSITIARTLAMGG